jgi:hypothetical protein
LGTELGVIIDAGEKAAKEEKKKKKLPLAQPIPNFPFSSDFSLSDRPFERNMPGREHAQSAAVEIMATGLEVAAQLDSIADEVDELMDHVNDIRRELRVYGMTMSRMGRIIDDSPEGNIIPTSKMAPMQFENPYELCFALLYLIETDDDMPWCYGAGCGLMSEVCESLPWGVYEYDEFEDEVLYSSDYTADSSDDEEELPADGEPEEDLEGEAEKAEEEPAEEKPVEMPDWYERRYESPDDFFPRSLAQILYEETGCILPRDLHRYDVKAKMLREYGVKDEDGILTMMTSLASARRSHEPLNFRDYYRLNPGKKEEKEDNSEDLKKEIKRLRDALHDAEKASRDAKRELEKAQSEARLEHRELADLRELVFNRENVEEEAPEQGEFEKYIVSQRTVVFGGHDSWVKAIKPLLDGEIRFIDKDLVFDVNIIRNADVLWIQPNAMSHKMYYRIVDNARLYKKPVRYFTYASAVKCAEQVAEGDT